LHSSSDFSLARHYLTQGVEQAASTGAPQPSHALPASMTISPQTTPAKIDRRVTMKTANPAATAP
jgi:hypothetical protein